METSKYFYLFLSMEESNILLGSISCLLDAIALETRPGDMKSQRPLFFPLLLILLFYKLLPMEVYQSGYNTDYEMLKFKRFMYNLLILKLYYNG